VMGWMDVVFVRFHGSRREEDEEEEEEKASESALVRC
jgi:hypothetical protein